MGSIFTIFGHLTELWVSFSGDFSPFPESCPIFSFDLRNYDPKILQNSGNYGYQFFGQNGTSPSEIGRDTPPPREVFPSRLKTLWIPQIRHWQHDGRGKLSCLAQKVFLKKFLNHRVHFEAMGSSNHFGRCLGALKTVSVACIGLYSFTGNFERLKSFPFPCFIL